MRKMSWNLRNGFGYADKARCESVACVQRMLGTIACLLLLCSGISGAAAEQTYTFSDLQSGQTFVCTDFEGTMPDDVATIFAPLLRPEDALICGSRMRVSGINSSEPRQDTLLLAVRREGAVLLMGAFEMDGRFDLCLETDSFIPPDCAFDITVLPEEGGEDWGVYASHAILCGDEIFRIRVWNGGLLGLVSLEQKLTDGTRMIIEAQLSVLRSFTLRNGVYEDGGYRLCSLPQRLAAWQMQDIPRNAQEVQQYADAHQPMLGENQAYICGVNLREKPTGSSRSLGMYSARVEVLDSQPGTQVPWYCVRVGDTQGWVSGDYLIDGSRRDARLYGVNQATRPFARADVETALRRAPDGETFAKLLPGATMHVIAENEGWLHVIVPREGPAEVIVDWDGVYGYVRADEVVQGDTLADLKWK